MKSEYQDIFEDINVLLDRGTLSKWEDHFLTSILDLIEGGKRLTPLQLDKVRDILNKYA